MATHLPLGDEGIASVKTYLDHLILSALHNGERIYHKNRVQNIQVLHDSVRAEVKDAGWNFDVLLSYSPENKSWSGSCSCNIGADCKHCGAVMFAWRERLRKMELSPGGSDQALPAQAEQAPEAAASPTNSPAPGPREDFLSIVKRKLGRTLTPKETRAAQEVDAIYKQYRNSQMLYESLFSALRTDSSSWGYHSFPVWPSPPQSPWEAWVYIAGLARDQRWKLHPFLEAITDWDEVDALAQRAREIRETQRWRDWLAGIFPSHKPGLEESIQLRVRITPKGMQLEQRRQEWEEFSSVKAQTLQSWEAGYGSLPRMDPVSLALYKLFATHPPSVTKRFESAEGRQILLALLGLEATFDRLVTAKGTPYRRGERPLAWQLHPPQPEQGFYRLELMAQDGNPLPKALAVLEGNPTYYVTADSILIGPPTVPGMMHEENILKIPTAVLETSRGIQLLDRIGVPPPEPIAARVRVLRPKLKAQCWVKAALDGVETLNLRLWAEGEQGTRLWEYVNEGWEPRKNQKLLNRYDSSKELVRWDCSVMEQARPLLDLFGVQWTGYQPHWERPMKRNFPEEFALVLEKAREFSGVEIELDPLIGSLGQKPVAAQVTIQLEEAAIDWFDLKVALQVSDTTLTDEEIQLLLKANGRFVRLGSKGWRKIHYQLDEIQEKELADLGLNAADLSSESQRLHALQLAGKTKASHLLPPEHLQNIQRRAQEIRTRVTPELPKGLQATLRPYQIEGFHFLAYLSENRFGGILADDMGLGKTLQTLAWLLWLDSRPGEPTIPSLVVCPKSVTNNWAQEAERFAPSLRVHVIPTKSKGASDLVAVREKFDVLVINYSQLRLFEDLHSLPWRAVILDEAQYIKNPQSQTAHCAKTLQANHRLALSGTPIENRLLDLWSILDFAMPGILGNRASFTRNFDQRTDPLARRRLAARVRPFVLRRTKTEVAKDLPERIEEDRLCEMEADQAKRYKAELKRARAALLKIRTRKELDKMRFNILTSLLRLRQICCHPVLVDATAEAEESTKLSALFDLLEPLVEEGQKVLVFSQFVQMLEKIKAEIASRGWPHQILTGQSEDRAGLVQQFQQSQGPGIFLISLRAGGFGLNLTAASYVVLFDPWWNPAVEAQAIDRTHRIGQKNTVIAYRLLVKGSIEEKIRALQTSKRALAEDLLGEENFTRTLTLEDFKFLLE